MNFNQLKVIGLTAALFMAGCSSAPSGGYDIYLPTEDDVLILQTAKSLLENETQWTRNEETQCNLEADSWTLFCALQKASYEVLGEYQLRRPALEEVRIVVEQLAGVNLDRRLLDFNNRPETTFEDIHEALDIALKQITAKVNTSS